MDFTEYQSSQDNTTAMGDLFERLVQLYLLTSPEFESKIENVWWPKFQKLPEGLKEDLNLTFPDEGIDLVAKTRDGNYWPIQAKYESDTAGAKTKKNLTSFSTAAFVAGENMSFGIVAHTKAKPIRKRRLLESEKKGYKIIEWGLAHWLELSDLDWLAIRTKAAGKSHRPKRRKPHPHQKLAIQKAKTHFINRAADRGRLIMPCASGKSLTAFWIAKEIDASTIVIALPSLSLIKQTVKDWTREFTANREKPTWICICSDETVGELDDADNDIFVKDLYDLGLPVTTTANQIIGFLKDSSASKKIIFTTYVSSPILAEACKSANVSIDFCVFDEAHKTAGRKNKRAATLLNNSAISIKKRLFMTATERFLSGSGNNEKAYSMDDETVYGACFHSLSFKAAIDQGIICDYKIITVSVTQPEIQKLLDERELLQGEEGGSDIFDASSLAAGIALEKVQKRYRAKHAISFHKSIDAAKAFKTQQLTLARMGLVSQKINYSHINGSLSAGERSDLMAKFVSAKQAVITNAKCLTEGVDVPSIDCVLFASPKQSVVDIVQAAGRAMRPDPTNNKQFGYVVIPIAIPEDMGLEEFASTTEFRTVAKQITALSTQDERIAEYFRLKENMEAPSDGPIEIIGEVPVGMEISFKEFASGISTKVWDKVAKVNWRSFEEARKYAKSKNFSSVTIWAEFSASDRRPPDIPSNPQGVYSEWVSWGDWLGTGTVATSNRKYLPYLEAQKLLYPLKLKSMADYNKKRRQNFFQEELPANPQRVYKEWIDTSDWLGHGFIAHSKRVYRSFTDARKHARSLKIESQKDWFEYWVREQPEGIPRNPYQKYPEWVSWPDWLNNGREIITYWSFKKARAFVRKLKHVNTHTEWTKYAKTEDKPKEIPVDVRQFYRDKGWISAADFFRGVKGRRQIQFLSYEEAKATFVHRLKLGGEQEWRKYKRNNRLPENIPLTPERFYTNWVSWPDWLGTKTIGVKEKSRLFKTFNQARKWARKQGIQRQIEWFKFTKTHNFPADIPVAPDSHYRDKGWVSFPDFLGYEAKNGPNKKTKSFSEARKIARKLKLLNWAAWTRWCKEGKRPNDIPAKPYIVYKDEGWISWDDWLGK